MEVHSRKLERIGKTQHEIGKANKGHILEVTAVGNRGSTQPPGCLINKQNASRIHTEDS